MKADASLTQMAEEALREVAACADLQRLLEVKAKYLGKQGTVTQLMRGLGQLRADERPKRGEAINHLKVTITDAIEAKGLALEQIQMDHKLMQQELDLTLPPLGVCRPGGVHPLTQVMERVIEVFSQLGYRVEHGPEVESDYYNFGALNFPENHPARDMQDTFFLRQPGWLLRTHTSPVQIRTLERSRPPIKIIAPGAVYRCDSDVTHSPVFHQVEGLALDQNITMADLKGTLARFAQAMFGATTQVRFRPSFFPFTEPSAEMDIACFLCSESAISSTCRVCSGSGWLEILGCGMVHPNVLRNVNLDPEQCQGFAFGMGIERIAMLLYGISDIRLLYENSVPFLEQFA